MGPSERVATNVRAASDYFVTDLRLSTFAQNGVYENTRPMWNARYRASKRGRIFFLESDEDNVSAQDDRNPALWF
jgi:hypothetical protein